MNKTLSIRAEGIRNIFLNPYFNKEDELFTISFGPNIEFKMNIFLADILSNRITDLHISNPDAKSIFLTDLGDLFNEEMINIVKQLFSFKPIQLNAQTAYNLRFLMIKLQNKEIYKQIDDLFPLFNPYNNNNNQKYDNFQHYILDLIRYKCFPNPYDNYDSIIPEISRNFYSIDKSFIKQLPKSILLQVISNENLKLQSEDSLYDFIEEIYTNSIEEEEISKYQFYEYLKFQYLSKIKFDEFISNLDFNDMTGQLWKKLQNFLKSNFQSKIYSIDEFIQRYEIEHFEYDNDTNNSFKGIISHLSKKCGGNVYLNNVVKFSYSSIYKPHAKNENIFDLENENTYFQFDQKIDKPLNRSWLIFDFGPNIKIKPNKYSIRSRNLRKGENHMKSWKIEGSNTCDENDWKILDEKN